MFHRYNLSKFTEEELCQIYNNLDEWNWDERLGKKPKDWDRLPNYHMSAIKGRFLNSKSKLIRPIVTEIEEMLGNNKLLEWHWIHNLGKTKEEYETWLLKEMADRYLRF